MKREAEREKLKAVMSRVDEADAQVSRERRSRQSVEAELLDAQGSLSAAEDEVRERDATIEAHLKTIAELNGTIGERDASIDNLRREVAAKEGEAAEAKASETTSISEAAASRQKCNELLEQVGKGREQAKAARAAMDQAKLDAWREVETLRLEVQTAVSEKNDAVLRCEDVQRSLAASEERIAQLEHEAEQQRARMDDRERAHADHMMQKQRQEKLARREDEQAAARAEQKSKEDSRNLAATIKAVDVMADAFEKLRADVALLTGDNEAFGVEMTAQREALDSLFELKSTTGVASATSEALGIAQAEAFELMALQAEQQRALDGAGRDLDATADALERLLSFADDSLQPRVDEAATALRELPLVQGELEKSCLAQVSTLSELRVVRDAAEEERQRHLSEMGTLSKQLAQETDNFSFTQKMQGSQIAQLQKELAESSEELHNWRNGNIRLSNAKQWRQERRGTIAPGESDAAAIAAAAQPPSPERAEGQQQRVTRVTLPPVDDGD